MPTSATGPALWASYLEAQGYDLAGGRPGRRWTCTRAQEILREHHNPLGTRSADSVNAMVGNFPVLARLIRGRTAAGVRRRPAVLPGHPRGARRHSGQRMPGQPFVTGTITDVPVAERHSQLLSDRALSTIMPALAIQLGGGAE